MFERDYLMKQFLMFFKALVRSWEQMEEEEDPLAAAGRPGRHRGQVPGAGGAGRRLLDDVVQRLQLLLGASCLCTGVGRLLFVAHVLDGRGQAPADVPYLCYCHGCSILSGSR